MTTFRTFYFLFQSRNPKNKGIRLNKKKYISSKRDVSISRSEHAEFVAEATDKPILVIFFIFRE